MYTPPRDVPLPMVHSTGPWGFYGSGLSTVAQSSGTWQPSGIVYQPILVPVTCVVRRLWWANGATVSASYNVDCGIYANVGHKPGARLLSTGTTAQGTASEVQFVDVTDTSLAPGLYWLALGCDSGSATFFGLTPNTAYDAALMFQQSSTFPLPATATPVEVTTIRAGLFGFATTASP